MQYTEHSDAEESHDTGEELRLLEEEEWVITYMNRREPPTP